MEKVETVNGDTVIEMEITPNRPDLLNVLGVAREISAILSKDCIFPRIKEVSFPRNECDITIEDKDGCSRYIGTLIEGVSCDLSPKGILNRISSLGIRGVNNVVDITNFCLMEMGQPMHAFDYDKLEGGKLFVRRARKGEKIVTIDEVERELDPSVLVIADKKQPVAIAGIMGGKNTEVSSGTKNILLESAYFDPIQIRRTSRKLGLSSDSSYRFERGVDYETVEKGASRAIELILEHAKGTITAHTDVVAEKKTRKEKEVKTSLENINAFLGSELTLSRCKSILTKLGFDLSVDDKEIISIIPPKYRSDVKLPVDIFEEIGRIVGYDNLPMTLPLIKADNVSPDARIAKRKTVKKVMLSQGFNEVITYSMFSRISLARSGQGNLESVGVINSLSQEQEIMRPSLLPSLLPVVLSNGNKGQKDLKLFEAGRVYTKEGEKEVLGVIATGLFSSDWRETDKKEIDFYDIKGSLDAVFLGLNIDGARYEQNQESFLEEGQRADVFLNNKKIGYIGKIDSETLQSWGIKQKAVYFAEIDLELLFSVDVKRKEYKAATEYPAIVRDISLAIDRDVSFDAIRKVATEKGGAILSSVEFREEYIGDKIEKGKRGVVFSLTYQAFDRTLTEDEVNVVNESILQEIVCCFKAVQR